MRFQQNLSMRRVARVVLTGSTKWSHVLQHTDRIAAAVAVATPGSYSEVEIPFESKPAWVSIEFGRPSDLVSKYATLRPTHVAASNIDHTNHAGTDADPSE
jgi:hypothetical protein